MSQHRYETLLPGGTQASVLMGWDRPLQRFFLVVDPASGDEYLYSNLDDPDADGQPLAYFVERLSALGVQVPTRMLQEIELDRRNNVGNRQVEYSAEGGMREFG